MLYKWNHLVCNILNCFSHSYSASSLSLNYFLNKLYINRSVLRANFSYFQRNWHSQSEYFGVFKVNYIAIIVFHSIFKIPLKHLPLIYSSVFKFCHCFFAFLLFIVLMILYFLLILLWLWSFHKTWLWMSVFNLQSLFFIFKSYSLKLLKLLNFF